MANRFWIGPSGGDNLWSNINNWSLTSNGSTVGAIPTSSDAVTFDGGSAGHGDGACSIATLNRAAASLTITGGYLQTITFTTNLAVSGSINLANAGYTLTGAGLLRMIAAGTWTTNGKTVDVPVEIGGTTTFTCTLADAFSCGTNALTWTNTTSTIFSGAFGITCGALTISGSQTITLSGNVTASGLLTISDANLINGSASNFTVSAAGITMSGTLGVSTNQAPIILTGGTWSGASVLSMNTSFAGNVTVSGSVAYGTGTLTYTSGTITTTSSTLNMATATTLNTDGITWASITTTGTSITYTLTSNLTWSGTLTISNATATTWSGAFNMAGGAISITTAITTNFNCNSPVVCTTLTLGDVAQTLAGSAGLTCDTWTNTLITAARTHTLTQGNTYTVTTAFSPVTPTAAAGTIRYLTITSSHASNKTTFTVDEDATQLVAFVSPTRLDSGGGMCLLTLGTITTSFNWTTTMQSQFILNAGGGETLTIAGVTKDNFGNVLGSCDCYLFRDNGNNTPTYLAYIQSNASTGAYSFTVFAGSAYFVVAFKNGSPNVMDVTDRTLVAV